MSKNKIFNFLKFGLSFFILLFACLPLRQVLSFAQEQFVYDAKGKRNPFIPLITPEGRLLKLDKEETKSDLLLEGIIYDKHGRSFAIVNSSVVGIGDFVDDYQVLKIEQNKVILIKGGQTTEIGLNKEGE
jgi:hypothetical protein